MDCSSFCILVLEVYKSEASKDTESRA